MTTTGQAPRLAALQILTDVEAGHPFGESLDQRLLPVKEIDRPLVHELAAGVLRHRARLDNLIDRYVTRGIDSVPAPLLEILRLGAYQLSALDRVPAHAAVDTTVALARRMKGTKAANFVNAVLRKIAREVSENRSPDLVATHPEWLARRWADRFGVEAAQQLMEWNDTPPPLILQPARWSESLLLERWRAAGIEVHLAPHGSGLFTPARKPTDLPGYDEGAFIVQDPAQALVIRYWNLEPNAVIYDACAAPGGKTIALAHQARLVLAGDRNPTRVRRLRQNLERAGRGNEFPIVTDLNSAPIRSVPVVVLDAPCLGTGSLARHPEARWRVSPEALENLARAGAALLDSAATLVAPKGLLLYATCSLEPEENEFQIDAFLARHQNFRREAGGPVPRSMLTSQGDLMVLPHRDAMDGAFAARLRRIG